MSIVPFGSARAGAPAAPPAYAELLATSNFSFLRGGSDPEELVAAALDLGHSGLGLCDRNSLAGVVRIYSALKQLREDKVLGPRAKAFRYVVGARLVFADKTPDIVVYPADRAAYGRLCALLTTGNRRVKKGECHLEFSDLAEHAEGQLFIATVNEADWAESEEALRRLVALAPGRVWLAAAPTYQGGDRARLNRLAALAGRAGVKLIATNDVLYHIPERRMLQDVLTCIREHLTIFAAGRRLAPNAERHLKSPAEMARLFREHPEAIAETQKLLTRIAFDLSQLRYAYPEETVGNGETAQQTLERLTWEGAKTRYPAGIPYKVKRGVVRELRLIAEKRYAAYFLTVHDIVRFAREDRRILCQGRGSAANSMVCYCLGVTEVDPMVGNLVFGRFLSTERDEPPDIDVDFEHQRREEVIQYIYEKYGRPRAGLTATVVTYRTKGAVREVAKVFGLSDDTIAAINQMSWGWPSTPPSHEALRQVGLDPADPLLAKVLRLAADLIGFPRHLSQHVGGFVLTRDRLDHTVPIANAAMEGRTTIEWDKDDIDALKILKVDILALGMLSCVRRAFELMHMHYGEDLTLDGVLRLQEDCVYDMAYRADTIGVFQIESRAQMSMLPRLRPREFYDLVIEVAIVRPGPIQGGMVHPYLKRRLNREKVEYPSEALRAVLERTLGIPLFQEQAMQIAVVGAGFSPGKADGLRRAMATFKRNGTIHLFRRDFIEGMVRNGYQREFAERCFKQIEGFGEYGFPESHAASFALLVYVSCWLKCHYPDVFACALLNSQPMGFYAPAQIVRDAIEHGVEVRPVDINLSDLENLLEDGPEAAPRIWPRHGEMAPHIRAKKAVRLGFAEVKGLSEAEANIIVARRGAGYSSICDLWLRTGLGPSVLEKLAAADAFGSLGLDRRAALWAIRGLNGVAGAEALPLFAAAGRVPGPPEPNPGLPPLTPGEAVIEDYRTLKLSLKDHPVRFLRPLLQARGVVPTADLGELPDGMLVETAGLVLVRQRPGTASGVIFMTLEDETGVANLIIWNKVFTANRRLVLGARMLVVRGRLQREGLVTHIVAQCFADLTPELVAVAHGRDIGPAPLARADEGRSGPPPLGDGRGRPERRTAIETHAALPKGRNFH